jgi:hypothetical protein
MYRLMQQECTVIAERHAAVVKIADEIISSRGLSWDQGITDDSTVNAVYIATPDHFHSSQALKCVEGNKHVLVEKPLHNFENTFGGTTLAEFTGHFQVGFHRRHDEQFQKAKVMVEQILAKTKQLSTRFDDVPMLEIHIESFDPVPVDTDLPNVVRNSMTHDLDCAIWMLESCNADLELSHVEIDTSNSGIKCELTTSGCVPVRVLVDYRKCDSTYTQKVTVGGLGCVENIDELYGHAVSSTELSDTQSSTLKEALEASHKTFGYIWEDEEGQWPCEWPLCGPKMAACWEHAYVAQFHNFIANCERAEQGCEEFLKEKSKLMATYKKGFALMDRIAGAVQ